MNFTELSEQLGENPKTTSLLVVLLDMATKQQAILDTMTKDHNEIIAMIRQTSLEQQHKDFSNKVNKTYYELKADITSFII
jgi:hypothetical protein